MDRPDLFVGIVGSRRRNTLRDRKIVHRLIEWRVSTNPDRRIVIVSGHCERGADEFAESYADLHGLPKQIFPIDKTGIVHRGEFTKRAYTRNYQIAETSQELYCLVHPDRLGGTENTLKHGLHLAVPTFLVDEDGWVYLTQDGTIHECDLVRRLLD